MIEPGRGNLRNRNFDFAACFRYKRGRYPDDPDSNDYVPDEVFFDKSWSGFGAILEAYRTGHLHMNANICAVLTRDDMNYWGMDELALEPCCAGMLTNRKVLNDGRLGFAPNGHNQLKRLTDLMPC